MAICKPIQPMLITQ